MLGSTAIESATGRTLDMSTGCRACGAYVAADVSLCSVCVQATADPVAATTPGGALYAAVRPGIPWPQVRALMDALAADVGFQPFDRTAGAAPSREPFAWLADDLPHLRGLTTAAIREQQTERARQWQAAQERADRLTQSLNPSLDAIAVQVRG
jgi:hypothetical protein